MSLAENGNGMVMPVGPMYGNNAGMGWGDGSFWIIVLFLFAIMGGNGFNSGFGGGYGDVQRGFDQQSVMNSLNGLTGAVTNGFANAESAAANRQMASMQQNFATQTAIDNRLDSISMALQNCCCENRAATADLKYTVANEAATTRAQSQANTQAVLDKLCQLELDGIKQNYENRIAGMQNQIDSLRSALGTANDAASQTAQTARLLADNAAQTQALEQYLNPTPIPAYMVQNPNCCGGNRFGYVG